MNVYEATIKRINFIFERFDYVYISFSGGKDSGVLLNLTAEAAARYNKKFGIFHMDYECQYSLTTEYVLQELDRYREVADIYHCCIPFKVTTCTSMSQSYWRPWDPDKKNIWVRSIPSHAMQEFTFYKKNMWDYDFQVKFGEWISKQKGSTCCLVGIRTQESFNRWRAIYSERNYKNFNGLKWTKDCENGCINAYPIYDWDVKDIWTANAKFGYTYNKLYDLYYMAGLNIFQMRVASPFISEGSDTLKLYRVIEPDTWGKMIGRVNGVNFTGIYGGTTAMGWKSIKLPNGHTWESFMYFLLDSLPNRTRQNYLSKLETSMQFWKDRGGCLSESTINKLKERGINIEVAKDTSYHTDKKPVRMKYIDDIDISEFREIPTFKRMCICIMKNDHLCKYMGFSQTKNEMIRRKNVIDKYRELL